MEQAGEEKKGKEKGFKSGLVGKRWSKDHRRPLNYNMSSTVEFISDGPNSAMF